MALSRSLLRNKTSLIIELALLAPVAGLLTLGAMEIQRMRAVESQLANAAGELAATTPLDSPVAGESRRKLSSSIGVNENEIAVANDSGHRVTISVPYAKAGSTLAFLWSDARISATAARIQ